MTHGARYMPREVGRELGVGAGCPDVQLIIWAKISLCCCELFLGKGEKPDSSQ